MRISEVLISGFLVVIMAREGGSAAGNASDITGYRNYSSPAIADGIDSGRILSRKRRFIAFPLGSSFSVAVCMTIGVLGNPNYQYLSLGLNWGLAYELPNSTWVLEHAHGFGQKGETPEPVVKRRYRRELYQRLELIMDRSMLIQMAFGLSPSKKLVLTYCFSPNTQNLENRILLKLIRLSTVLSWDGLMALTQTFVVAAYETSEIGEREFEQEVAHHRSKRYVAFPEGSSFTCAVCATVGVVGSPQFSYLSYGLNWGVAYDLPNETWILHHLHGFGKKREPLAIIRRRNRRSLYQSIETTMDSMGYNGRDCILRALCESRQFFQSNKLGMIPELLRTVFSLPKTRLFTREIQEHSEIEHYNRAYFSDEYEECELKYPCSFSLLELAMGKYSEPQSDYYGD